MTCFFFFLRYYSVFALYLAVLCQSYRKHNHTHIVGLSANRVHFLRRPFRAWFALLLIWTNVWLFRKKTQTPLSACHAGAQKWLLNVSKSRIMCHSWADNPVRATFVLSGMSCFAHCLTQHQKKRNMFMARLIKRWSESTSLHSTCFYESSWVSKKKLPDIASFVCYVLLHVAAGCSWKEAFARRASLSNNVCREWPISWAKTHFQ